MMVAYTDHLVILVSRILPSVTSVIMERALRKVRIWIRIRYNPNQNGADATKWSYDHRLLLSSQVKDLGVILDFKLNWRLNTLLEIKKSCIAFYTYMGTFERKGGLLTRIVLWMYTAVVLLQFPYEAAGAESKIYRTKFDRIQRTAWAGTPGALQSCSADPFNVLMYRFSLNPYI